MVSTAAAAAVMVAAATVTEDLVVVFTKTAVGVAAAGAAAAIAVTEMAQSHEGQPVVCGETMVVYYWAQLLRVKVCLNQSFVLLFFDFIDECFNESKSK